MLEYLGILVSSKDLIKTKEIPGCNSPGKRHKYHVRASGHPGAPGAPGAREIHPNLINSSGCCNPGEKEGGKRGGGGEEWRTHH